MVAAPGGMEHPVVVTVMFTDLVESTAAASAVGDGEAERLRRDHYALLRSVARRHGGTEVKNLGDGLMLTFPGPSAGLRAAVEVQTETARRNRGRARAGRRELTVRIGLNTGEARSVDGDWFGLPVVIAKRLCDVAAPGQVLTSAETAVMARNAPELVVAPAGARELKGVASATEVVEVTAPPDGAGRVGSLGLPTKQDMPFVGRSEELDRFAEIWRATLRDGARIVGLAGEPGAGKTRLALELAHVAADEGARIVAGACDDGSQTPFQPIAMAVAGLLELLGEPFLDEAGIDADVLAPLVPRLAAGREAPAGPPAASEPDRLRLFDAVATAFGAAADRVGLVLVLDDAQWVDASSAQLLRHVARAAADRPLLVMATYRDSELTDRSPFAALLADASRRGRADTITVGGLSEHDVALMVEAAAGVAGPAATDLAGAIHASTDGNAFFAEELCRQAADHDQDVVAAEDPAATRVPLPSSVRTLVRSRTERLTDEARDLLAVGAVLGREFRLDLAERVGGGPPDPVDELIRARLVFDRANGRAAVFVHDIIREAVHVELPPARRRRLHRDVAAVLADEGAPAAEVARHLDEAGGLADEADLLQWTARAADEAVAALAFEQAVVHAERALDVAARVGADAEFEALLALGDALYRAGEVGLGQKRFLEAAERARALGDPRRLGRVALAISGFHTGLVLHALAQADPRAGALLEEAAAGIASLDVEDDGDVRLRTVLASAAATFSNQPRAARTVEVLVRDAHRRRDWRAMTWALLVRPGYRLSATPTDEHVAMIDDLITGARAEGLRDIELFARSFRVDALLLRGEGSALDEELEAHRLLAAESRAMHHEVTALALGAMRLIQLGLLDEATATADRMFRIGSEVGYGAALSIYGAQTAGIAYERNGAVDLRGLMESTLATIDIPEWAAMLSLASAVAGDHARAHELVVQLSADGFASLERSTMLLGPSMVADTCCELRRPEFADALLAQLEPASGWHAAIGTGVLYAGPVDRAIGRLRALQGDLDAADHHLARAIGQAERADAPTWVGAASQQRAEVLLLRGAEGDRALAHELLRTAAATAERYGLRLLADRVVATTAMPG